MLKHLIITNSHYILVKKFILNFHRIKSSTQIFYSVKVHLWHSAVGSTLCTVHNKAVYYNVLYLIRSFQLVSLNLLFENFLSVMIYLNTEVETEDIDLHWSGKILLAYEGMYDGTCCKCSWIYAFSFFLHCYACIWTKYIMLEFMGWTYNFIFHWDLMETLHSCLCILLNASMKDSEQADTGRNVLSQRNWLPTQIFWSWCRYKWTIVRKEKFFLSGFY